MEYLKREISDPSDNSKSEDGRDESLKRMDEPRPSQARKVMVDAEEMKNKIRQAAMKPDYNVCNFYYEEGLWQEIARHQKFEYITLAVIAFNALWISIDTDLNHSADLLSAHAVFQFAEHGFCIYFSFEWYVRFKSFKKKRNGLKDAWFVFDSTLVFMMVGETWIMTLVIIAMGGGAGGGLGNASMLRMARLLRLSRMARMARLFKAMPELLILIKAMVASLRSCVFVFILLTLILYVFGIAFRQLTDGTQCGEDYFPNVPEAMHTLWIDGTLMDSTGNLVQCLRNENFALLVIFYIFLCFSALAVMNMLIGIICEVVSAVAATEKESLQVNWVKTKLQEIICDSGLDEDKSGKISKREFSKLLEYPAAVKAIEEVDVDVEMLIDNIDFIFEKEPEGDNDDEDGEKELTFEDFMGLILALRGSNTATVKDIKDLEKIFKGTMRRMRRELESTRTTVARASTVIGVNSFDTSATKISQELIATQLAQMKASDASAFDVQGLREDLRQMMQEEFLPAISKVRSLLHCDLSEKMDKLNAHFDAIRSFDQAACEQKQKDEHGMSVGVLPNAAQQTDPKMPSGFYELNTHSPLFGSTSLHGKDACEQEQTLAQHDMRVGPIPIAGQESPMSPGLNKLEGALFDAIQMSDHSSKQRGMPSGVSPIASHQQESKGSTEHPESKRYIPGQVEDQFGGGLVPICPTTEQISTSKPHSSSGNPSVNRGTSSQDNELNAAKCDLD